MTAIEATERNTAKTIEADEPGPSGVRCPAAAVRGIGGPSGTSRL
jgi:hypothetical protein